MNRHTGGRRLAGIGAIAAFSLAIGPAAAIGVAATGGTTTSDANGSVPGDSPIPFWPHETGALVGTSETYADVREDGSYYDPSIERRVSPANRRAR